MNAVRLTQKSAEAIRSAQQIAQEYGTPQIEQVHLLWALLQDSEGLIPQLLSGMGVTVHKDGRTVTLTVTSADGLVRTVYTVHVEEDAALAALSSTGKGVGPAAAIAALLAMLGVGVGVASRRREM